MTQCIGVNRQVATNNSEAITLAEKHKYKVNKKQKHQHSREHRRRAMAMRKKNTHKKEITQCCNVFAEIV